MIGVVKTLRVKVKVKVLRFACIAAISCCDQLTSELTQTLTGKKIKTDYVSCVNDRALWEINYDLIVKMNILPD